MTLHKVKHLVLRGKVKLI